MFFRRGPWGFSLCFAFLGAAPFDFKGAVFSFSTKSAATPDRHSERSEESLRAFGPRFWGRVHAAGRFKMLEVPLGLEIDGDLVP